MLRIGLTAGVVFGRGGSIKCDAAGSDGCVSVHVCSLDVLGLTIEMVGFQNVRLPTCTSIDYSSTVKMYGF